MANEAKEADEGERGREKGRRRRAETKPKVAIIKLHFVNAAVAISNREKRERGEGEQREE